MGQAPLHLAAARRLAIAGSGAPPAGLGWALGLLGADGVHQDGGHVAAGGQLVEPVQRQQRPLPAALPRTDDLDGHVLVAVGQLPDFLGQGIKTSRTRNVRPEAGLPAGDWSCWAMSGAGQDTTFRLPQYWVVLP
jgi:hypothetical protein